MMAGMVLAAVLYRPLYTEIYSAADLTKKTMLEDTRSISNATSFTSEGATVRISSKVHEFTDGTEITETTKTSDVANSAVETTKSVKLGTGPYWYVVFLIAIQVILVTMVYGPIAAFLV